MHRANLRLGLSFFAILGGVALTAQTIQPPSDIPGTFNAL
jgi:hypothetical protein